MFSFEVQRGRGEGGKCEEKGFLKTVCLRRVLYPTGSMQQLLNGRAVLPDLYRQGRGFAPVHCGKNHFTIPTFGNDAETGMFCVSRLNIVNNITGGIC